MAYNISPGSASELWLSLRLFFLQGKYDEEIEVYKHHLEQTYKLCRPCQAAVEYYIKHQNRQLRALLLNHHFSFRKTDKTYMQVGGGCVVWSAAPFQAWGRQPSSGVGRRCIHGEG